MGDIGLPGFIAVPSILYGRLVGTVKRTCISVFIRAWCVGECTNLIDLRCVGPSVGIDCLPDGKQSIHISVRVTFWFSRGTDSLGRGKEKKKPYA